MRILSLLFFFYLRANAQDSNGDQHFQANRLKIRTVRLGFDSACLALLVLDELLPWHAFKTYVSTSKASKSVPASHSSSLMSCCPGMRQDVHKGKYFSISTAGTLVLVQQVL